MTLTKDGNAKKEIVDLASVYEIYPRDALERNWVPRRGGEMIYEGEFQVD